jgi:peptidoglycan hydrolase-like protein with peptidoglycan-binding domain
MATPKNNKALIIGAGALAAVGAVMLLNKKNDTPVIQPDYTEPVNNLPVATNPSTPAAVTLNKNIVLKMGSRGNEVKELQKLLGISADGIFGAQTEAALFAKKGFRQITLKQYAESPNMNNSSLKVGDRVMANKKPTPANKALKLATGGYADSGNSYGSFEYGKEIGRIVAVSTPTKTAYAVETTGLFSSLVWINASDVVKI